MGNIITQQDALETVATLVKDYEYYNTDNDVSCSSTYTILTKDSGNCIIGCIGIKNNTIKHLRIKKKLRVFGYGTKLLLMAEKLITKRGYTSAIIHVHQNNRAAIKFFKKNKYLAMICGKYYFTLEKELNSICH